MHNCIIALPSELVKNFLQSFLGKVMGRNLTQAERLVLGMGAKVFTIADPVIVFGTVASVVYGVIYWIFTFFYFFNN